MSTMYSSPADDIYSSRKHSLDDLMGRLLKPVVGSVNHPAGRLLRRISRASLQVWTTTTPPDHQLPTPPPAPPRSLDDTYLGGELPEDPFSRGPQVISHTTLSRYPQSPSPEQPIAELDLDSPTSETDDLDNDDAKTITLNLLYPPPRDSLSDCSSQLSESLSESSSSFHHHPCLSTNSNLFNPQDDFITLLERLEATRYGEWSEFDDKEQQQQQQQEPSPPHPHDDPNSFMFPDLSPMSIPAASVAYHRRYFPSPVRRVVSTPPCSTVRREQPPRKTASYTPTTYSHQLAYTG